MPYKQKNGTWRAARMIAGKRKTKIFGTKAEAKAWESNQNQESWTAPPPTPMVSLAEWANAYLDFAKERVSEKTYGEKKRAFRLFFKQIDPALPAEHLTLAQARVHLAKQAKARTGAEANKDKKNLAAGWTWGTKYLDMPTVNPFSRVEKFKADKKPRYVPSEEDFWKACEAVDTPADRVFLLTLLHTAARRGELFRLRWDDVDFENSKIRLGTRKREGGNLEYDWIPMTSVLAEALRTHKRDANSVFVFSDALTGQPYEYRIHLMGNICRRAGVRKFGFHAIRHLSASMMAKEGVDIPTIQAILRHQNSVTTSRYLRSLGNTRNVLEGVFGSGPKPGDVPGLRLAK